MAFPITPMTRRNNRLLLKHILGNNRITVDRTVDGTSSLTNDDMKLQTRDAECGSDTTHGSERNSSGNVKVVD